MVNAHMRFTACSRLVPLLIGLLGMADAPVHAATLTWDANTGTTGAQDGAGTWQVGAGNWFLTSPATDNQNWLNNTPVADIAQFGVSTTTTGGQLVTISGTVNVSGINFLGMNFSANANGYRIGNSSGTLAFDANAIINIADNAMRGSGNILINPAAVTGNGLTFQKSGGTGAQRIQLAGANTSLTGVVTVRGSNGGVILQTATPAAIQSVSKVVVESGATLELRGTTGNYDRPLELAGHATTNSLLVGGANTVSGAVTLTSTTPVLISRAISTGSVISGVISEAVPGAGITFVERGILSLTAQNTYTGATQTNATNITDSTLVLDFSTLGGGQNDILYNGAASAGPLTIGHASTTVAGLGRSIFNIQGAASGTNSQRIGNVTIGVNGATTARTAAEINLTSGAANTLNTTFGTFTKGVLGSSVRITGPASGGIMANNGTSTNGLVGPFVLYQNASGTQKGWAGVTGNAGSGGAMGIFTGSLSHSTGTEIASLAGYSITSDLTIGSTSGGTITQASGTTQLATVSMTDDRSARSLGIGSGNTLRLGENGGIQIIGGAQSLTVGTAGSAGTLTAGDAGVTGANDLYLTNMSSTGTLTVNSVIANNGASGTTDVVNLVVNGTGKVVLTGHNTFTGSFTLHHGSTIELQHSNSLGTSAGTNLIFEGGEVQLSGGIIIADTFTAGGTGLSNGGAFHNLSGTNTLAGVITGISGRTTRFTANAGSTLNLNNGGTATSNIFTVAQNLEFGGAGTIMVANRLNVDTGTLTKDGTGSLILNGSNVYSGDTTISAGVLRLGNNNALGTSSSVTVSSGAALEFSGGITVPGTAVTLSGTGIGGGGSIRNVSGSNVFQGTITVSDTAGNRINADGGTTLTLTAATAVQTLTTSSRTVTFGGAGTINLTGAAANTGTRVLTLSKDGSGTLNLRAANSYTGITTVSNGVLNLDFANATPTSNLLVSGRDATSANTLIMAGGELQISGKTSTANTQSLPALTTNAGRSQITLSPGSSGGTVTFNTGTYTRAVGSTLNYTTASGATLSTTTVNTNGTLGGSFTIDKTTWASSAATQSTGVAFDVTTDLVTGTKTNGEQVSFSGTVPAGLTSGQTYYVVNSTGSAFKVAAAQGGTAIDLTGSSGATTMNNSGAITGLVTYNTANGSTAFTPNGNIDVTAGRTQAAVTINTLRFNTAGAATITLTGSLTISSGGILVTSAVGANDITIAGTTSNLITTTATSDLVMHQHNTSGNLILTGRANVNSNGSMTKTGLGSVILTGTHNNSNISLRIQEGSVTLQGNNLLNHTTFFPNLVLGSGSSSGKLVLKSTAADQSQNFDSLVVSGSGTSNAIVGGGTDNYGLIINSGTHDLTNAVLGGSGSNENNLNLVFTGGSTTTLGGSNTFDGSVTIRNATVNVSSLANAGTSSSLGTGNEVSSISLHDATTVASTALINHTGSNNSTTDRVLNFQGGDATNKTTLTTELSSTGTGTVAFTSQMTNTGDTSTPNRVLRLSGTNTGDNSITGIDSLAGVTTSLEKTGSGKWVITGTSAHNGSTTVSNGTLQLGSGGAAGSLGVNTSSVILGASTATLRTNRSDSITLSQTITGTGNVEISNTSTGITVLTSASNTYSGSTSINGGSLQVGSSGTGVTGTGVVTVQSSGTILGTGVIQGARFIAQSGSTVHAGDSTAPGSLGTLRFTPASGSGSFDFQSGSSVILGIAAGGSSDLLSFDGLSSGSLDFNGSLTVLASGYTPISVEVFNLLDWSNLTNVNFDSRFSSGSYGGYLFGNGDDNLGFDLPDISGSGYAWDISNFTVNGTIATTLMIPEPARALLLSAGLMSLFLRRRRPQEGTLSIL